MNSRFAVPVLLISSIGWGLTWLALKGLNEMGLNSMLLILFAFISGSLVLLPWLIKQRASWKNKLSYMLMIAISGGFANVAFQAAIYHGEVIRVMILFYMLPVWSVLGGRIVLKEKIDPMRMLAVALCLSGAYVILDVWHVSWQGISWIDLLAIGSGFGLASTNILFRYTQDIPVMSKIASTFIGCTVLTMVLILTISEQITLPDNNAVPFAMLYGAVWLTLVTTGTQWAVTQMEAGRSAVIIVMELVAAVVSLALITNTELKAYEIIGGIMVISAAVLEGSRIESGQPEGEIERVN
ncbi:MAG: DMT family transporter [Gammaproteobacteria bacterium]|nr:DMT family transporter [Gammaproteobacteria bacterium]